MLFSLLFRGLMIASDVYTRVYPASHELDSFSVQRLQQLFAALEDDINLLDEETRVLAVYLAAAKGKDGDARMGADDDGMDGGQELRTKTKGRNARRKSSDPKDLYLSLEDKHVVLGSEQERLRRERDRGQRAADDARDVLQATMEEATSRIKEMRLEMGFFAREVLDARPDQAPTSVSGLGASIDKIMKYFADRPATKQQHSRRIKDKCAVLQQQITKNSQSLRQKDDVGEAFHMIDFDQLKIENHQFVERIEQKNLELVDLKGTTTRTVQALNRHMDRLNAQMQEQQQLQKELTGREEFHQRLKTEMDQVQKDGKKAQRKNENLKIQHEAVRVPKVEDYIAQKAEMLELEKAAQSWKRKVEIAAGQVAVMKQRMLSISKQQKTIIDDASRRGKKNFTGVRGTAVGR